MTNRRAAATTLLLAVACVLAACAPGHGRHTEAFRLAAQDRMDRVKAGATWDMARQRYLAGDLEKALDTADDAIALAPDVAKSHELRARVLIELGRYDAAIDAADSAIELDPSRALAHYVRGLCLERFGRFGAAALAYVDAGEADPTNPQHALAAAEMLVAIGHLGDAEALLIGAAERFEHNAGIRQLRGHVALIDARPGDAVGHLGAASRLAPNDDVVAEDLARAHIAAADPASAEPILSRLLRSSMSEPPFHNAPSHGRTTVRIDSGVAQQHGQTAAPRDLRHLHARCLLTLERSMEARAAYLGLTRDEHGAHDAEAWLGLARAAAQLGDTRSLTSAASRLRSLAPNNPDAAALQALALVETHHPNAALRVVGELAQLDPDHPDIDALRQRIERAIATLNESTSDTAIVNVPISPDN